VASGNHYSSYRLSLVDQIRDAGSGTDTQIPNEHTTEVKPAAMAIASISLELRESCPRIMGPGAGADAANTSPAQAPTFKAKGAVNNCPA